MTAQYKDIMQVCEELHERERYIGEIRAEMKETIENYAKAKNMTPKAVKNVYRLFKELRKDRSLAELVMRESDLLAEAMMEAGQ